MMEEPIKETLGAPKSPLPVTKEKSPKSEVVVTTVPLVSEIQLMAATGGAELSCYRCIIPFAVVVFIAGIVVTAVAYSFNSHGSIISIFGLVLLSSGLFFISLQRLVLEGETTEQESQETGESDGSRGTSEKPVCLRLNETNGTCGLKILLYFVHRFALNQQGENGLDIGSD